MRTEIILFIIIKSNFHTDTIPYSVRVSMDAYLVRSIRVGASVQEQLNHLQMTLHC